MYYLTSVGAVDLHMPVLLDTVADSSRQLVIVKRQQDGCIIYPLRV